MKESIAPEGLRQTILMWAAIAGLFFGLMPPYVFTIVVVATWGVPALEPPSEQAFRTIYFLRLVLGNVVGLTLGAFLAAAATNIGLRVAGKATYLRGAMAVRCSARRLARSPPVRVRCCYSSVPLIRIGRG